MVEDQIKCHCRIRLCEVVEKGVSWSVHQNPFSARVVLPKNKI